MDLRHDILVNDILVFDGLEAIHSSDISFDMGTSDVDMRPWPGTGEVSRSFLCIEHSDGRRAAIRAARGGEDLYIRIIVPRHTAPIALSVIRFPSRRSETICSLNEGKHDLKLCWSNDRYVIDHSRGEKEDAAARLDKLRIIQDDYYADRERIEHEISELRKRMHFDREIMEYYEKEAPNSIRTILDEAHSAIEKAEDRIRTLVEKRQEDVDERGRKANGARS